MICDKTSVPKAGFCQNNASKAKEIQWELHIDDEWNKKVKNAKLCKKGDLYLILTNRKWKPAHLHIRLIAKKDPMCVPLR